MSEQTIDFEQVEAMGISRQAFDEVLDIIGRQPTIDELSTLLAMWEANGEKVLTLDGDRRMVEDDCVSQRLTLKKGRNVLRFALVNGPGLSDLCVRFIAADGKPVKGYTVKVKE